MTNYMPEAPFDVNDEPIGDQRWFYQQLVERNGGIYTGRPPGKYSPHTGTEEREIKMAILEGKLKPRNGWEKVHRSQIDFPRPRDKWPKKWVTCNKCKGDWLCTGFPAGQQTKYTDAINCHQLKDYDTGIVWLYPPICQSCADYRESKPAPKKPQGKKVRQAQADP